MGQVHFWTMSKGKRFFWGLLLLGCESSLTSQHYACPISLSLGDQSNSAFSSLVKTYERTVAKSKQIFSLTNRQGQVSQKRESPYLSAAKPLVWMQRRHTKWLKSGCIRPPKRQFRSKEKVKTLLCAD